MPVISWNYPDFVSGSGRICQSVIDFVFLCKVQSQDRIETVKNPLQFDDGRKVRFAKRSGDLIDG